MTAAFDRILLLVKPFASRQLGVVTSDQFVGVGASLRWQSRYAALGRLVRLEQGIYLIGGGPASREARLMAACLHRGPDVRVACRSAAHLWRLPVTDDGFIHLVMPRSNGCRSTDTVKVHKTRQLLSADLAVVQQLPATTLSRTILDLGAELTQTEVNHVVDHVLMTDIAKLGRLRSCLERNTGQGVAGTQAIRDALAPWLEGSGVMASHAETAVARWLIASGFRGFVKNYEISLGGIFVGRVDMAWPALRVALEVDSYKYHHGPRKLSLDHERKNALVAAGYVVLTTTAAEVRRGAPHLQAALVAAGANG